MTTAVDRDLIDTPPPHNDEAEMTVLGQMMMWPGECIEAVLACCGPQDCFRLEHQRIFAAILAVDEQTGGVSDLGLLCGQLEADGGLENVGGRDYLITLADTAATPSTAKFYAQQVRKDSDLRRLADAAAEALRAVKKHGATVDEVAETLEAGLAVAAGNGRHEAGVLTAKAALAALDAREGEAGRGIVETGLIDLDHYLAGGCRPGQMIVVAGKTSFGKTSLALGIARHAALERKVPVAIFSTEMPAEDLVLRLLASVADVDGEHLRRNTFGPDEQERVSAGRARISEAPLYFVDAAGLTAPQFRIKSRQLVRRYKVGLIVLDYLQQVASGGREETRQVEVAAVSRTVKLVAGELKVPVIALSQLSRKADGVAEPRIDDLRASGTIEEDADVVLLLHRNASTPDLARLIVGKNRNGRTGHFGAVWNGSRLTFRNFTPRERQDAVQAAPPGEEREAVQRRLMPADDPSLPF